MIYQHPLLWTAFVISPLLVGGEQVCFAQESDAAVQVRKILADLDDLQKNNRSFQLEWEWKLIEAIELGPPAVPELIRQLDATPADDRRRLRNIPFILRGIGDRRAIPALIRAIPKCYGKDGSDVGARCEDPELLKLLQKYDNSDRDDELRYSYGRPINEVFPTLKKWTGNEFGWLELAHIHDGGSLRQKQLKRKLFETEARRWEKWWLDNWQTYTDDANYALVGLPAFEEQEAVEYEFDRNKPLERYSGWGSGTLGSIHDPDRESNWGHDFYDLNTGRRSRLPEKWQHSSAEELRAAHEEIRKWASDNGFNMFGSTITHNGREYYVIETVDVEVWQIPKTMNKFDKQRSANDFIGAGRKTERYIACFDTEMNDYDYSEEGTFFYITSEGTPGILSLGTEVRNSDVPAGQNSLRRTTKHYEGRQFSLELAE